MDKDVLKQHKKQVTKYLGTKLTKKLREPPPGYNSNRGKHGNQVGRLPKAFSEKRHKKIFYLDGHNAVLIDGIKARLAKKLTQSDILNDILEEWLIHQLSLESEK